MELKFKTNRILITGASGWLGSGVLNALLNGIMECELFKKPQAKLKIRVFVLKGEETRIRNFSEQIEVITGNLVSNQDCERFCKNAKGSILLHLAGIIHPKKKISEFYEVNFQGTKNILQAARQAGVYRVIALSSNSPMGCNPHNEHVFDEKSPYHPYMNYGKSKHLLELVVKKEQALGALETVIIRAPWFYGPFQPLRQKLFFKMIRDGKVPIVGGGENRRSMVYIDNLAQGILLSAIHPKANGEVYWIADENPYTMNQVVDTIEYLLENEFGQLCKHKRLALPGITSEIAFGIDWLIQKTGFYSQKLHVLSEMNKTIACSIKKAKDELGYEPTITLEEGMRISLNSLKKDGILNLD